MSAFGIVAVALTMIWSPRSWVGSIEVHDAFGPVFCHRSSREPALDPSRFGYLCTVEACRGVVALG